MKMFANILFVLSLAILPGCKWFACDCSHDGHGHTHEHPDQHAPTPNATPKKPSETVTQELAEVIKITTTQEFEEKVIAATKPVLVDFSAKWCGPCQAMKPIVEELAQEMSSKYIFVEVNVDAAGDVANKYNIKGIPTFAFFKDGKEVSVPNRLTGAVSKKDLIAALEKNLG